MPSKIFHTTVHSKIEKALVRHLNAQPDFLSVRTAESTRAVGDAISSVIADDLPELLKNYIADYSADFARRAMADLAFTDRDGLYYIVDANRQRIVHFL